MTTRDEILARLDASPGTSSAIGGVRQRLVELDDAALAAEVPVVEAALRSPDRAADSLTALWMIYGLIDREPAQADRLPAEVRLSLIAGVAGKQRAFGATLNLARALGTLTGDQWLRAVRSLADTPPRQFDNGHNLLVAALRAAPEEALPDGVLHHGGPIPKPTARSIIALAVWCAARVAEYCPASEKPLFEQALGFARAALAGEPPSQDELEEVCRRKPRSGAFAVARAAATEVRTLITRPDMTGTALRPAMAKLVPLLLEQEGVDAVRSFLVELDDALTVADVRAALERRKKEPTSAIVISLWRGADDKGAGSHWLARLEDGRYGLLSKPGRNWVWTEGRRDDLLAMVPDERFEEAVRSTFERDPAAG